jgi:tRNA(Ile2) C34 agmatinyltransferase TiaS
MTIHCPDCREELDDDGPAYRCLLCGKTWPKVTLVAQMRDAALVLREMARQH